MTTNSQIIDFLNIFAPLNLAEEWDNVGLLLGRPESETKKILTCLTLTPDVAMEAIDNQVSLIVSHHPILFRPVQKISSESLEGEIILSLVESGIAVYSPHTAFDSAREGINRLLAEMFQLENIQVLRPKLIADPDSPEAENVIGAGRFGDLPEEITLKDFLEKVRTGFSLDHLQYIGNPDTPVSRVGIACGSAAEFMDDALDAGCDLFLTGEARFHDCLKARASNISMVLVGHYASERLAVEQLATVISKEFPTIDVRASKIESDPLKWI